MQPFISMKKVGVVVRKTGMNPTKKKLKNRIRALLNTRKNICQASKFSDIARIYICDEGTTLEVTRAPSTPGLDPAKSAIRKWAHVYPCLYATQTMPHLVTGQHVATSC